MLKKEKYSRFQYQSMYTNIENKDSKQNTFGGLSSNTDSNCTKVYKIGIFIKVWSTLLYANTRFQQNIIQCNLRSNNYLL